MGYHEILKSLRPGVDLTEDPEKRDRRAMGLRRRTGLGIRRMIINLRLLSWK